MGKHHDKISKKDEANGSSIQVDDYSVRCNLHNEIIYGPFAPHDVIYANGAQQDEVMGYVSKMIKCRKLLGSKPQVNGGSPGNNTTSSTGHGTPIVEISIMSSDSGK